MKLKPHLAPIKVAVIPLARNHAGLMEAARKLRIELQASGLGRVILEDSGNIGKAYRRHDEVGTPSCVTIDYDTIGEGEKPELKGTATVRDRDTTRQERVALPELEAYIRNRLRG